MQLVAIDWVVIALSIVLSAAPAVYFARRASSGISEFFASGRSAPWWLIGTSMVATTFSTDTPNLVTDFVRTNGVSQNWAWWAFLLTGMLTVFFYAKMWRRSGVLTDLEFYELRYSGRSAAFVRGFRAIYLGFFFNCAIMASVTLAAAKIANVMLGWDRLQTVLVCSVICVGFAAISGLWGVLASDLVQFVIAMIGVIAAAFVALSQPQVGGLAGLMSQIDPKTLRLLPDFSDWGLTLSVLIVLPLWDKVPRVFQLGQSGRSWEALLVFLPLAGLLVAARWLPRTRAAPGSSSSPSTPHAWPWSWP
jgi:Na+/proline symporter